MGVLKGQIEGGKRNESHKKQSGNVTEGIQKKMKREKEGDMRQMEKEYGNEEREIELAKTGKREGEEEERNKGR